MIAVQKELNIEPKHKDGPILNQEAENTKLWDKNTSHAWYLTSDAHTPMSDVRCPIADVRCLISYVRNLMSDIQYAMSDVWYPRSDACPMSDTLMSELMLTSDVWCQACEGKRAATLGALHPPPPPPSGFDRPKMRKYSNCCAGWVGISGRSLLNLERSEPVCQG